MSNALTYERYGFDAETGVNLQQCWSGTCDLSEDTHGRGCPDWVPENTTPLPPPAAKSIFDLDLQGWVA